jgi:hypothetical protein
MSSSTKTATELSHFVGLKIVIKHSPSHCTCKIKMNNFLMLNILRWKFNRPANLERSQEIADSLLHKKQPLSFIFQCIYNKEEKKLEIIDGLHRYYAIKILKEQLEDNERNEWFYNSCLLIECKINNTEGEVIDWFQSINKCSPVLDLYVNRNDEKREIVEEVVNEYYSKYTEHFKGLKHNIPNTSREKFTEIICHIYDTFHISLENKKLITKILEHINNDILDKIGSVKLSENKINSKLTKTQIDKCYKTGLYLFLATKEKLYQMIAEYKL